MSSDLFIASGIAGGISALLLFVVLRVKKSRIFYGSKWGVNMSGAYSCPKCGTKLPEVRNPRNMRQVLWGGWTCANCGVELDKWMHPMVEGSHKK
jgi:hypothetical protein